MREKQLRLEYEAREQELQRGYAEKEELLEKQIENYRRAQEAELAKMQKTIDLLTADCDKELAGKQKEIQRLEEELQKTMDALRESEKIREQERRSSELREREQRGTVKKMQDMIDAMKKASEAAERPMPDGGAAAGLAEAGAGAGASAATSAAGGLVGSLNAGSLREPEDTEDGWMDGMSGGMDGTIIRRGAVNQASRNPFSSGLRPETAGRREEPARRGAGLRREESVQRGAILQREESVQRGAVLQREDSARRDAAYQKETDRETAVKTSTVMDDLVEMAASDDRVLKEELFSIDECLENVMVLQEPVCAKKRIKLELKKSVSMPDQAIGDKAKLQRALVSLLETAAEQTPQGGVINLGCRADRASGNRAYMYFTIRDNGSSIASDLMQGMFEMKDERDDPLRAGLYIAREIVSIMGGNVRVRSRRGEGTEFMVTVCMKLP